MRPSQKRAESNSTQVPRTYVAACFDAVAEDYAAQYCRETLGGYVLRARQLALLRLMEGLRPGRVLDVGCGPAFVAEDLIERGWSYIGVDASWRTTTLSAERHRGRSRASFGIADTHALPFPDATFDAVLCIGVIDRVESAEAAIAEMNRVLAPGGALLVSFPNRLSPYAWWQARLFYPAVGRSRRLLGRRDPTNDYLRRAVRLWTPKIALAMLRRSVGHPLDPVFYGFVPLLSPLDQFLPALALRSARALEPLSRGRLRQLGSGFLVKAQKPA